MPEGILLSELRHAGLGDVRRGATSNGSWPESARNRQNFTGPSLSEESSPNLGGEASIDEQDLNSTVHHHLRGGVVVFRELLR